MSVMSAISAMSVCAVVALSGLAVAQNRPSDLECKTTETQAECHARLKCKPDEELDSCQKRLLKCRANEELGACKKRVDAEPAKEGSAGRRDDADNNGRRDADQGDRDRDADRDGRRDRDDADREHGDRSGDDGRRQRGQRQGDNGGRRRGGGGGSHGFQANKTFGLGLELGEPTGLNGKYFVSESGALDFGIGWIYSHYYYGDGIHLYADYLWHPTSLVSASAFELPFYIGVGLRYWDFDYCDRNVCTFGGSAIGVRVPIGISFDFNHVPLDIFLQLVPVLDIVRGDYYDRFNDREHFGVDLSAGFRYWFK
jgi:hypothetical protein